MLNQTIELTAVFEYIADAGYVAYAEELNRIHAIGVRLKGAKKHFVKEIKMQDKRFDSSGRLVEIVTKCRLLIPKLTAQD